MTELPASTVTSRADLAPLSGARELHVACESEDGAIVELAEELQETLRAALDGDAGAGARAEEVLARLRERDQVALLAVEDRVLTGRAGGTPWRTVHVLVRAAGGATSVIAVGHQGGVHVCCCV